MQLYSPFSVEAFCPMESNKDPLVIVDLIAGYEGKPVAGPISFNLYPGQITALLGPNGSGKSTLLKTICGALPPIEGKMSFETSGKQLNHLKPSEISRLIGYVPQSEDHYFPFSVREVVLMGRMPYSSKIFESAEDHLIADQAMEMAECAALADRPVTEISGGEKQRVLIARAIAQQPKILVLDEPNSHLDFKHVLALGKCLKRLAGEGMAIVAALHDLNLALEIADYSILLQDGKVVLQATTQEVLQSEILDDVYEIKFNRQTSCSQLIALLPCH